MEKYSCCFFGHADAPYCVGYDLILTLIDLIENHDVKFFYVGTHGNFDKIVYRKLCEVRKMYPFINVFVVLPDLNSKSIYPCEDCMVPDGFETVPHKFLINHRNKWMLDQCDYVVAYIAHSFGGAAKFVSLAEKKKKKVINLYFKTQ